MQNWKGLIHRYGDRMNIDGKESPVTLLEGNTPLIPAPSLARIICPGAELLLKFEGLNPTGSFKDRGMTAAITDARAKGARVSVCASTGNTAASAAAYSARAGLKSVVIIPKGNVALGKLAGSISYGATLVEIDGTFDQALALVRQLEAQPGFAVVNSVSPARLEGQKTAAWELLDQVGSCPHYLSLPVGNAGNISAYHLGFSEHGGGCPRFVATQAAGAAPLVLGRDVEHPSTRATAIRIGKPARGTQALKAIADSNGILDHASDEEIFDAYRLVSRTEGVFCEPSSAASICGVQMAYEKAPNEFQDKIVVCVLTGHGMKDPDAVFSSDPTILTIAPTVQDVLAVIA